MLLVAQIVALPPAHIDADVAVMVGVANDVIAAVAVVEHDMVFSGSRVKGELGCPTSSSPPHRQAVQHRAVWSRVEG